jgi:hypothetical protein
MERLRPYDIGAIPATVDRLMKAARDQAGLSDFGDLWFLKNLRDLLWFVAMESGGMSDDSQQFGMLVGYLVDRLRLIDYLKRYPEARDEKLDVATVIISPARSGSTMLQGLLGASPQLTSTYYWEDMMPLPLPGEKPHDPSPRIEAGRKSLKAWFDAMVNAESWHHLTATSYEEEIFFFDRAFLSCMYTNYFYVPTYTHWMMSQDQTRVYDELALWLKVLQHQKPERRGLKWLLKAPHYYLTGSVETIMKTFPAAKMIWIHRRVDEMIPSIASISSDGLRGYGHKFEMTDLGENYMRIYRSALDILLAFRRRCPAESARFIDLNYRELVGDPLGTFCSTLKRIGVTPAAKDEAAAKTWLAQNARSRDRKHQYTAEQFGVTTPRIASSFTDYHALYNL